MRIEDALRLAAEADLDLVEVAAQGQPPVCKLMDYGKFKYESALKAREDRKKQVNTVIKEMKLRPKIDPHDYETKKGHIVRFLSAGDKVKVTIMFRGREQSRPELGFRLLQRLADDIADIGFVESSPKQDGRNMIMVIGPLKKKTAPRGPKGEDGTDLEGLEGLEGIEGLEGTEGPEGSEGIEAAQAVETPESTDAAPTDAAPTEV